MKPQPDTTLPKPTRGELLDALDEVVRTVLAYRRKKKSRIQDGGFTLIPMDLLLSTPEEVLSARSLASDPVDYALTRAASELGQLLLEDVGDTARLCRMVEDLCERSGDWQARVSFIDKAFDGIAIGNDVWCA